MRRFHTRMHWFLKDGEWCYNIEAPDVLEQNGPRLRLSIFPVTMEPGSFLIMTGKTGKATSGGLLRPYPLYIDEMPMDGCLSIMHWETATFVDSDKKNVTVKVQFPLYSVTGKLLYVALDITAVEIE